MMTGKGLESRRLDFHLLSGFIFNRKVDLHLLGRVNISGAAFGRMESDRRMARGLDGSVVYGKICFESVGVTDADH